MKRQVADRLFLAGLCLTLSCSALFGAYNGVGRMMALLGGAPARVCYVALGALSILTLVDTVLNDMLPDRYAFRLGWKLRQGLWLLIATTFVGTAYASSRLGVDVWITVTLTLYGFRCAAVSFLDLYYEHRDAIAGRRSTDFGALK